MRRCDGDLLYIPIGLLHQSTMMQVPNDMSNLGMRSRAHMLPDRQLTQLTHTHSYCKGRVPSLGVACRCGKLKFELDLYGARTIMLMVNGPYASGYDRIIFARPARLPFAGYPELGSTVGLRLVSALVYSVFRFGRVISFLPLLSLPALMAHRPSHHVFTLSFALRLLQLLHCRVQRYAPYTLRP